MRRDWIPTLHTIVFHDCSHRTRQIEHDAYLSTFKLACQVSGRKYPQITRSTLQNRAGDHPLTPYIARSPPRPVSFPQIGARIPQIGAERPLPTRTTTRAPRAEQGDCLVPVKQFLFPGETGIASLLRPHLPPSSVTRRCTPSGRGKRPSLHLGEVPLVTFPHLRLPCYCGRLSFRDSWAFPWGLGVGNPRKHWGSGRHATDYQSVRPPPRGSP